MRKFLFSITPLLSVIILFLAFPVNGNAQALKAETTANSSAFNPMPQINFNPFQFDFNATAPNYGADGTMSMLFDNGSVFNVAGPPPISFLQDSSLGMGTFGFGCQFTAGNTMADDFTLSNTATIESIDFYSYQTGASGVSITGVYVRIYDGEPGAGGSVIWGDMTTNVLENAELSGGYRQLESTPGDTSRAIQKVTATIDGLTLADGTYWVEVTFDGTGASGPWAPPITITGQGTTGNALQFLSGDGAFAPVVDGGILTPQGLPFQIYGTEGELDMCTGTPDAGTITGPDSICPNIAFTLKAEGATSGFDGLERQWQSSPAGENNWTDIAGANGVNYNVAAGISASMDYRFVISCTASGESATSAVHTVLKNDPSACYCMPSISTVEPISRVVLADIDNPSDPNGTLPYEDFTSVIGNVAPGETYEGAFEGNTSGSWTNYFTVFIDWNQNGILNDEGEVYPIGSISGSTGSDGQQAVGMIEVPDTAASGATRMRVIKNFNTSPTNPCGTYTWGQVEDYTLFVGEIEDCTGTPDAGTVTGPDTICANTGFVLKAEGASSGSGGLTRQWQSSPAGQDNWTDVAGATSTTYNVSAGISAATDYRFVVTCTASGESAATDVHSVTLKPGSECYCFPSISTVEAITRVVVSDIDNSSPANSTSPYEDFTAVEGHMAPGATYEGAFEGNTAGNYTTFFTVFIDWNQNGSFLDAGEMYQIGSITNSSGTDGQQAIGNIAVPTDAMEGTTRMRVIKNYNTSPTNPCGTYSFGQTEDYTIIVAPLEDCSGTPEGGTVSLTPEQGDPGTAYTVKSTGYSFGNGLTYQWQSNTAGAGWVDEGDATSSYANYNAIAPMEIGVSVDWRLVVTCSLSEESAESTVATFTTTEPACGFESLSNGFEDGFGFMEALERANDFVVPVNTRWHVNQVKVNMFVVGAASDIEAADITFYEDSGNGPGAYLGGEVFASPASVDYAGSNFGIDIYTLTFDVDQILEGSPDSQTVFWVGVLLYANTNTYWEVNYTINSPNPLYSNDGNGSWTPSTVDYGQSADGVMQIVADCELLKTTDLTKFDFAYYPNPVKDVLNITADAGIQSVTAYNLAGQKVLDVNSAKAVNGKIDVTSLPKGVYLFKAVLNGGQVETFKIIKK